MRKHSTDAIGPKLCQAISELATNPDTPTKLYEHLMEFLAVNSQDLWERLMVEPAMVSKILDDAIINEAGADARQEAREQSADAQEVSHVAN